MSRWKLLKVHLFVYIVWIEVTWSAFVCVYFMDKSFFKCFCLCFKCLEFFIKEKYKTKTVLLTSILILLIWSAKKDLLYQHLSAVQNYGSRVISMMSLCCRYCSIWTCFTASSWVSFVDFERVIADCLDKPLLHLNFLTGVNSLFTLI